MPNGTGSASYNLNTLQLALIYQYTEQWCNFNLKIASVLYKTK